MINKSLDNIAIVFNGLYMGGAEKFGISLANKFVENGHATSIIFFKKMDSPLLEQINSNINIIYINRTSKYNFILHHQFNNALQSNQINKVIIIGLLPLFLSRVFAFTKKSNIQYFLSLHSTIPASFKIFIENFIFLRFAKKTDKVLFICKNQQQFYYTKYKFKPVLNDVIYNGVDINYFKPGVKSPAIDIKAKLQLKPTDKVIVLVATIRKEKGHTYAIEALKYLHTHFPNKQHTHLIFIGGGNSEYLQELQQLVNNNQLQHFVHFEGNQKEVRDYYSIADIFTLTSFSVETFSIAALEAMSFGIPLSLTNIGGAAEMVIENKNGLLSIAKNSTSIATTWANLLDANLNKQAIRDIAVANFSLPTMFTKYQATIFNPNLLS